MRKLFALSLALILVVGCSGKKEAKTDETASEQTPTKEKTMEKSATGMPDLSTITFESGPEGLEYYVETKGEGAKTQPGQTAVVHYTGWLLDGKKFDSSVDRGNPFEFVLGQGRVIRGWEIGVGMMHIGDKWLLKLPPEIAYGPRGAGGVIPPNATLLFEVEVLNTK